MRVGTTILVVALVLGAAGAAAWFALRDAGGAADVAGGGQAPATAPAATPEAAPAAQPGREHRARAKGPGAWTKRGEGTVVGVVREHGTDRGLAGVPVELTAGADGPDATLHGTTAADGAFRFEGVADFAGWTFRARVAEPKVDVELGGVSVLPDRTTDLGTVWAVAPQALAGVVVDSKGAPVEGAEIRVLRPFRFDRLRGVTDAVSAFLDPPVPVDTARTGSDGRFRLLRTPPGSFDVTADKDKFARGVERVSLVPGAAAPEVRLRLAAGHAVAGLVVRRGATADTGAGGATASPSGGALAVRATGMEGIVVRATPADGLAMAPWLALARVAVATTDDAGHFLIGGLAPGKWKLLALVPGEVASDEVELEVPRDDVAVIQIGGDAWLAGKVTGPGDAAIAGARVFVNRGGGSGGMATAVTGADGAYKVGGLASGSAVHVFAEARGHASSLDLSASMKHDSLGRVTLVAGANTHDLRLAAGGSLKGRVVEKGGAKPLEGVRVAVRQSGPAGILGGHETFTAADGAFEVRGLPAGKLSIHLEKTGWHPVGKSAAKNPFAALFEGRDAADEPAGADPGTGYEIVSAEGTSVERSLEMERATTVVGRVTDAAGAGVAGARVKTEASAAAGPGGLDPTTLFAGIFGGDDDDARVTDASGGFELTAAPGTPFVVSAKAEGFVDGKSAEMTGAAGSRVECAAIVLSRGATIEGVVTSLDDVPAEGVEILWKRALDKDDPMSLLGGFAKMFGNREPVAATTGADGAFRLIGVPPGKVSVTFRGTGFRPLTRSGVATKDGETVRLDVTLDRGATVAGRVVDESGNGLAGVKVTCTPKDGEEDETSIEAKLAALGGGEKGTAVTGADGSFKVEGVAPGVHQVAAKLKGLHLAAPVEATADGDPVTVQLVHGLSIAGRVRCDGKPAAGVRVSASRQVAPGEDDPVTPDFEFDEVDMEDPSFDGSPAATTKDDGAFELKNLAPGKYRLSAASARGKDGASAGTSVLRTTVKDVAAGAQGVTIDCGAGLVIAGTVTLPDGSRPKEGTVSLEKVEEPGAAGPEPAAEETDEEMEDLADEYFFDLEEIRIHDGAFRVIGLAPGKYTLTVEVPGGATAHVEATAGRTDVQVKLQPSGGATGRIVMPGGTAAPRVHCTLTRAAEKKDEPGDSDSAFTDRSGRFSTEGLVEGAWTLTVENHLGGRIWTARAEFVVRAGETTKLPDVTLRDAGPVPPDQKELEDDEEE